MRLVSGFILLLISLVQSSFGQLAYDRVSIESVGGRVGFSAFNSAPRFEQYDIFSAVRLPWRYDFSPNWSIHTQVNAAVGCLRDPGHDAFIGSFGPGIMFTRQGWPFVLDAGIAPTYISRPDFGSKELGTNAQFTSHGGVGFDVLPFLRVGYRFQHMSNGGLGKKNPGLNLHMVAVSYVF